MATINELEDVMEYAGALRTISSHLDSAAAIAIGLYMHNPISRRLPDLDELDARINDLLLEVDVARIKTKNRFDELSGAPSQ